MAEVADDEVWCQYIITFLLSSLLQIPNDKKAPNTKTEAQEDTSLERSQSSMPLKKEKRHATQILPQHKERMNFPTHREVLILAFAIVLIAIAFAFGFILGSDSSSDDCRKIFVKELNESEHLREKCKRTSREERIMFEELNATNVAQIKLLEQIVANATYKEKEELQKDYDECIKNLEEITKRHGNFDKERENLNLEDQHRKCTQKYKTLQVDCNKCENNYKKCTQDYRILEGEHDSCQNGWIKCKRDYKTLQGDYDDCENNWKKCTRDYKTLQGNHETCENDWIKCKEHSKNLEEIYDKCEIELTNITNTHKKLEETHESCKTKEKACSSELSQCQEVSKKIADEGTKMKSELERKAKQCYSELQRCKDHIEQFNKELGACQNKTVAI